MKKNLDNIVFIMKEFYETQLKCLLIMTIELFLYLLISSNLRNCSFIYLTRVTYNNIFSGHLFTEMILWILIDVLPYFIVYQELIKKIKKESLHSFHPSTSNTLFAGIFLGFDLIWMAYFYQKYIMNTLIIGIRVMTPWLIIKTFRVTNKNHNGLKEFHFKEKNIMEKENKKTINKKKSIKVIPLNNKNIQKTTQESKKNHWNQKKNHWNQKKS